MYMNKSETIKELSAALAKAQALIEGAEKDGSNPHFRSKYATLASVVDAVKEPLAKNGLSYTQVLHDAENAVKVETIILHQSGEWLSCGCLSVPVSKHDAQGFGSALTYARRYSLSAAFGVAPEDDDGNEAAKAAPAQVKTAKESDKEGAGLLRGAKTLDDLQDIWRSLKPDQRASLGPIKDDCKLKILRDNEALQP
jgi:hypothetical protein